jgi:hypothetical protein
VNGKDYYVFLVWNGSGFEFKASLNKTAPDGVAVDDCKIIGGFHTLCADAGTGMIYWHFSPAEALDHPLNGYIAGDILPQSVWCLNNRPFSEPEGMVYIQPLDFWCDIYLQSGIGADTKSAYQGVITRNRQFGDIVEDQFMVKKQLLSDAEFSAAMLGSNEKTACAGASEAGATKDGAGGRVDTAGRRMLSIYGVEEGCGSIWQYLRQAICNGSGGPTGQSGEKGNYWVTGVLLAGANWNDGTSCGSRARHASHVRSYSDSYVGGRGRSCVFR